MQYRLFQKQLTPLWTMLEFQTFFLFSNPVEDAGFQIVSNNFGKIGKIKNQNFQWYRKFRACFFFTNNISHDYSMMSHSIYIILKHRPTCLCVHHKPFIFYKLQQLEKNHYMQRICARLRIKYKHTKDMCTVTH